MLAERVVEWTKDWKQQGLQEGLQEGLQQGLQQGREAERRLLIRQAGLRFGADCAARLGPLMADIDDQALLTRIGEWIIESPDGETLITRTRTLSDNQ